MSIDFVVDDLTNLCRVSGLFDFFVDYWTFDNLDARARDRYVANVLPLAAPGSAFLLWCFESRMRWWERLVPFFSPALEPGEADLRFGTHFSVERLAGGLDWSTWPPGRAAYWLRRRTTVS